MSEIFFDGVDPISLQSFEEEGYSDEDALDLAQSLLMEAIPCLGSVYEAFNTAQRKIVKYAVLEMAKYIKIDYFNFERSTSPFQSETIGSYTYSKMANSVRSSSATGVPGFDRAVAQFSHLCELDGQTGGAFSSSSEQVFTPGFGNFRASRERINSSSGYPYQYDSSIKLARASELESFMGDGSHEIGK